MTLGHFGVPLVRLRVHEGYLGATLVQFPKIYGLPPLPPTSSTRRLAIGGRRSAIGGICEIPLCLLTILTYHTYLTGAFFHFG